VAADITKTGSSTPCKPDGSERGVIVRVICSCPDAWLRPIGRSRGWSRCLGGEMELAPPPQRTGEDNDPQDCRDEGRATELGHGRSLSIEQEGESEQRETVKQKVRSEQRRSKHK